MFSSDARGVFALALFATLTLSCSRTEPRSTIQRVAILRFENLTGDDSLNWAGRAVSEVLNAELAGAKTISVIRFNQLHGSDRALGARPIAAPGISAERPAAILAGASQILYGQVSREGGSLRLDAVLFDQARAKIGRNLSAAGPAAQGVIKLADQLAKQVTPTVRMYGTASDSALQAYCSGLEAPDASSATADFSRAVTADANFGQAYLAWAEMAAGQGNRSESERILTMASARGNGIRDAERARLSALTAELRGDMPGMLRGLEAAGALDPSDSALFRRMAQAGLKARRFADEAQSLQKALEVEPENPELWNDLGYAQMFAGNLTAAMVALDEYRRIRPGDPNALDSLGDVNFYFGQFTEAEKYYRESFDKDNNFNGSGTLLKAAHARLRTGDVKGADTLFRQYANAREKAKDNVIELRRAEWEFLSGRRGLAIQRMGGLARSLPPQSGASLGPQLYAQLAVWELEMGDRSRAREFAGQAKGSGLGAIALYLTEPKAPPAEWKQRAFALLPRPADEPTRNVIAAYALLLQGEFSSALPMLTEAYQHSNPEPREILPVLLGWAMLETGNVNDAARLVQRNPIPNPAPDIFAALAFPRLLAVRAAVLAKQGRTADAERSRQLFLTLSGQDGPAGTRRPPA